jgi:hypothetical protein
MGAPLKPRKRRKVLSRPNAPRGENNPLWRLWNDPETRPMMIERNRQCAKKSGRPPGVPDGYTLKQFKRARARAANRAERIIRAMAKEDTDLSDLNPDEMEIAAKLKASDLAETLVDDDKAAARAALKEVLTIALQPGNKQTKLSALRTALEYTRSKPASTVNNNVNAAEDFLLALAKKDKS